jgi:hypothetical protein
MVNHGFRKGIDGRCFAGLRRDGWGVSCGRPADDPIHCLDRGAEISLMISLVENLRQEIPGSEQKWARFIEYMRSEK